MTAMMIDDGKRVAAGGARLQWHMIPIADIDLIARNTRGEENGVASKHLASLSWFVASFAPVMSYGAPWKRWIVTSTAEKNAIRRRICVVPRIRDAECGLVPHGNLAAPAPTVSTTRGLMHRKRLMMHKRWSLL